jgi:predicted  nucleic acid-binding Zn-ribbon protein
MNEGMTLAQLIELDERIKQSNCIRDLQSTIRRLDEALVDLEDKVDSLEDEVKRLTVEEDQDR